MPPLVGGAEALASCDRMRGGRGGQRLLLPLLTERFSNSINLEDLKQEVTLDASERSRGRSRPSLPFAEAERGGQAAGEREQSYLIPVPPPPQPR